jgi:hypothetical protein
VTRALTPHLHPEGTRAVEPGEGADCSAGLFSLLPAPRGLREVKGQDEGMSDDAGP